MPMELDRWSNNLADGKLRNGTNKNWDKIEGSYNDMVKNNNQAALDATAALKKSNEANGLSKNVQKQLDEAVLNGDSSPAADQARVDVEGVTHSSLKARLDFIESANPETGIIAFTFDDVFFEDRLTYSIFKEYGLPCTFAPIMERVYERNYIGNYRTYQNDGFTIMSHLCTHQEMATEAMSLQEATYEIAGSAEGFARFGLNGNGFVTPDARLNDKYLNIVKKNYDYAVTKHIGFLDDAANGHLKKTDDPYKLYRWSLVWNSVDKIKKAIDNCIKERGLLLFYDHRTGAGSGHADEAKLREVLAYVKTKVGNKQCRALNMNDAINSFYGKTLMDKKRGSITNNLAPRLNEAVTNSLVEGKWNLSDHLTPIGETYKAIIENGEELGIIDYLNPIPKGKANSLQTKIDLANKNMNDIENQSVHFALDIWCNGDISNTKFTLETRFFAKDGTYDGIHINEVKVGNKRTKFEFTATPFKKLDFSYVFIYLRFDAKEDIPAPFRIKIGKPSISFGIPAGNLSLGSEIGKQVGKDTVRLELVPQMPIGAQWPLKQWMKYTSSTSFENDFLIGSSISTFEAKKRGFYSVNLNAHFDIPKAGSPSAFCRLVFDIGKTGFTPNGSERSSNYYSTSDDRLSLNINRLIFCEKGDRIYIRGFYDDNQGDCIEYKENAVVFVSYIPI
ncbi:polysaccharide deacetylase family protein [Bacillus paramycoides]|uniref:polysaccharide deacetylase family protein n=1 Tax=Bacillus paramycoides TaxID=2026194 RepID=UPI002E23297E|nr:polysaccharide deacetylase family protein [Bacillus paramycoides]MED1115058.1 polysaccharide deacetylase family protein [Bacillus paramycoides]